MRMNHGSIRWLKKRKFSLGCWTDLREKLDWGFWGRIEEVQDIARMLDTILGSLFWGGKAIVPTAMEVFKAAAAVL